MDAHLLRMQCLQNRILRAVGSFDRHTLVCKVLKAFKISNVYDYITELCGTQEDIILNSQDPTVHFIGQEESIHRKYKWLELGSSEACGHSVTWLRFTVDKFVKASYPAAQPALSETLFM